MIVVRDDLDLAAVDAAIGVYLVGGELCRLGDGGAGNRLRFRDHADPDRVGRKRRARRHQHSGRGGTECYSQRNRERFLHLVLSLNRPLMSHYAATIPAETFSASETAFRIVRHGLSLALRK